MVDASYLAAGTYTVTAVYPGNDFHNASISNQVTQVVNKHATSTSVAIDPNPAQVSDIVTFTASVNWTDMREIESEALMMARKPQASLLSWSVGARACEAPVVDGVATFRASRSILAAIESPLPTRATTPAWAAPVARSSSRCSAAPARSWSRRTSILRNWGRRWSSPPPYNLPLPAWKLPTTP
ncbi:MAG: Ig-like domain repeat protein [Anaerolineales bacterium]|nr:Ig-like domain repeat protein [Anaerolineales bacterium]